MGEVYRARSGRIRPVRWRIYGALISCTAWTAPTKLSRRLAAPWNWIRSVRSSRSTRTSHWSRRVRGEECSVLGRHEEGIDLIEKTQPILPKGNFCVGFLTLAYQRAGRRDDAERMRADLEEAARHQFIPSATLALVAAALGDSGSAFARIEESIPERDPNIG